MYKTPRKTGTRLTSVPKESDAITLEQKIEAILTNKEPIKDGAPEIFTDRADGVVAAYNIRTDRWDLAADAMDVVEANATAKREARALQKQGKEIDLQTGKEIKPEPPAGGESGA